MLSPPVSGMLIYAHCITAMEREVAYTLQMTKHFENTRLTKILKGYEETYRIVKSDGWYRVF